MFNFVYNLNAIILGYVSKVHGGCTGGLSGYQTTGWEILSFGTSRRTVLKADQENVVFVRCWYVIPFVSVPLRSSDKSNNATCHGQDEFVFAEMMRLNALGCMRDWGRSVGPALWSCLSLWSSPTIWGWWWMPAATSILMWGKTRQGWTAWKTLFALYVREILISGQLWLWVLACSSPWVNVWILWLSLRGSWDWKDLILPVYGAVPQVHERCHHLHRGSPPHGQVPDGPRMEMCSVYWLLSTCAKTEIEALYWQFFTMDNFGRAGWMMYPSKGQSQIQMPQF